MLRYPTSRVVECDDTLAGLTFDDPYRWLESNSEEVRQWQEDQASVASEYTTGLREFDAILEMVKRFNIDRRVVLPKFANGRWFRTEAIPGCGQSRVVVAEIAMGPGTVVYDPLCEEAERPPFLSWISPSPDGNILAVGVCYDGSESNKIRLIDVATGKMFADSPDETLMDNWTGGVHWLPDSSGFLFTAITGAAVDFEQHIYIHRLYPEPTSELVEIAWTEERDWRAVSITKDGRYVIAFERLRNPIPVAIALITSEGLRWRPFIDDIPDAVAGFIVDDQYVAVTYRDAPRGRIVSVAVNSPCPNDADTWVELVPESSAVIRSISLVGEHIYIHEYVDTYSSVRVIDKLGNEVAVVPLPGRGAVSELPFPLMNLFGGGHADQYLFGFSSFLTSPGIYSHTPGNEGIVTLKEPDIFLDGVEVVDRYAVSKDGTAITYHLVSRGAVGVAPRASLIYAYGGFNAPCPTQFPGPIVAFIESGGVYVHAHIRGGAEFGMNWWQGGRLKNKQNCYDDLFAVAEDLIASGVTNASRLGMLGGSNGGLMAGVALTQRPDLWRVVVPRIPMLDLIGACREGYGRMAVTMEYADVEDPDDVLRLSTFSPYHLVRKGVSYPAVYIDAGDTDPRCPPWHARKFAARLQAASKSDLPILLHVWGNVGHGFATDKSLAALEHSEWLSFVVDQLGLQPNGDL